MFEKWPFFQNIFQIWSCKMVAWKLVNCGVEWQGSKSDWCTAGRCALSDYLGLNEVEQKVVTFQVQKWLEDRIWFCLAPHNLDTLPLVPGSAAQCCKMGQWAKFKNAHTLWIAMRTLQSKKQLQVGVIRSSVDIRGLATPAGQIGFRYKSLQDQTLESVSWLTS